MNRVCVVGVSHHTAPVAVRERLALTPDRARCLVGGIAASGDADDAIVVSTCNRTELYLIGSSPRHDLMAVAEGELAAIAGEREPLPDDCLYRHRGEAAIVHLFRVASGLDSLVPGETEILGQVREALAVARAERAAGQVGTRLFESAIEAGRRVRSETGIGQTPASVASVAATAAKEALGTLDDARVLVIGAGATAELVVVNLLARGAAHVRVANRTLQKAQELAERFDAEAVPMADLVGHVADADVVVSATNAPHAILHAADVAAIAPGRERPLCLFDLAVPRDVEDACRAVPNVRVWNVDDLETIVARNVDRRAQNGEAATVIVAEEAERFRRWLVALDVVPAITGLRRHAEQVRRDELARFDSRWESLSPRDRETVEHLTKALVAKLLHEPTVRMKDIALEADGPDVAAAVAAIFDPRARA